MPEPDAADTRSSVTEALTYLQRLLWECHCAASDGSPVPFELWLTSGGPGQTPGEVRELRDAYDTACEARAAWLNARTGEVRVLGETIDVEGLDEARRDPRVHAFHEEARKYAERVESMNAVVIDGQWGIDPASPPPQPGRVRRWLSAVVRKVVGEGRPQSPLASFDLTPTREPRQGRRGEDNG